VAQAGKRFKTENWRCHRAFGVEIAGRMKSAKPLARQKHTPIEFCTRALLSSWLGRLAAASALSFEELLEALRVRSAPSRTAEFYPGRLDDGCSRPLTRALSTFKSLAGRTDCGSGPQAALWHAGVVVAQSRRIPLLPHQAPAAGPAQLLRRVPA